MQPIKKLLVFPTARALRSQLEQELSIDGLLPKLITMGEFEKKAVIVDARTFIDEETRTLILNEASSFSTFKTLQIEREFFTFLKNSKYLFGFFDELSLELVDIDTLERHDTYAAFSEHIEILKTLKVKYLKMLDEMGYVDKINLPELYTPNLAYLNGFDEIELFIEGYLSNFEFKLLREIAQITPVKLHMMTNRFNQKMIEKFKNIGLPLELDHTYEIDLTRVSVHHVQRNAKPLTHYETRPLSSRILQVAYIKKKVHDYLHQGIDPQNIAIILPDGSFAKTIDLFDSENNFNFAMGFSYQETHIYKKLDALYQHYMDNSYESRDRLKRLGFDLQAVHEDQKKYNQHFAQEALIEMFTTMVEPLEDEATLLYFETLHLFSKLFPKLASVPFHKIFHLFLNRLTKCSLDDTRGGKITVMEILETRGVSFEALVVVDFNEGKVPSISQKDLFLSSELRHKALLPTRLDRENLQKLYYRRLFEQAKYVSVSYVHDEQNQPSRFLDELEIHAHHPSISGLDTILFATKTQKNHFLLQDLELSYDFTKVKLSATALKCYLDCKRKYYFQYIKKLHSHEIPKEDDSQRVIGVYLHEALKNVYLKQNAYFQEDTLTYAIQSELYKLDPNNQANLRFVIDVWIEKLKPFIAHEIKRAVDGYRVLEVEKTLELKIDDFTLTGQIDRIDLLGEKFEILDYKSGAIPKESQKSLEIATNFQLQFYYLLYGKDTLSSCAYYDLITGDLHEEATFDEKLDLLYQKLEQLKAPTHNFVMTENLKSCTYCAYAKICNRIL